MATSVVLMFSTNTTTNTNTIGDDDQQPNSRILFFFIFHKAIHNGLKELHQLAMGLASFPNIQIQVLLERYHYLGAIYKQHFNAKDKVRTYKTNFVHYKFFFLVGEKLMRMLGK